jgi:hypothetical protein
MTMPAKPKTSGPEPDKNADLVPLYRELAGLSAKARIDRIISRKDTMRVVRRMPTVDLYATIRDVGVDDCLEIIELMSPAQVQGFLDLDGWRRDRVDVTAMGRWLRVLFAANVERAVGQLRGFDIELLTLLLKIHCKVYDLTLDEEPEGDVGRHTMTPDQRFLIVFGGVGGDDEAQATLQQFLERLMARDMLFVLRICEAMRWELPSSLEEEALHWRNARLADLGFLPADEAAVVFAWVDPDKAIAQPAPPSNPPKSGPDDSTSTDLTSSPLLPWEILGDGASVISKAMAGLTDIVGDRVRHELMLTANRVHAAESADLGDADALKETARQVAATVGVGLAWMVQGNEAMLSQRLTATNVQHLFRIGHSLSLRLRNDLKAKVAAKGSGLNERGLLRLDAPLREVIAGLLRVRPLLYAGLLDTRRVDFRPIASLSELAAAAAATSEASFRAALMLRLGADDAAFADIDDADIPTHGAIFGAMLAQALSGSPWSVRPTTSDEVKALKEALGDEARTTTALLALDDAVRRLSPLPGAADESAAVTRARTYARQVLAAMTAEVGAVSGPIDGRFLASVWTGARRPRPARAARDGDE